MLCACVLLSEDVIWTKRTKLMRQTNEDYLIFQEPGESMSQHNDFIMMQVKKILKLFKKNLSWNKRVRQFKSKGFLNNNNLSLVILLVWTVEEWFGTANCTMTA